MKSTGRRALIRRGASCMSGATFSILVHCPAFSQTGSPAEMRAPVVHAMHWTAMVLEIFGVSIIVAGVVIATVLFFARSAQRAGSDPIREYRGNLGRGILLGLEFLVAADIIGTVAITPTFQSLGVLASIIAIRILLSFSLQIEIEGQWPWKRRDSDLTTKQKQQEQRSP